MHRSKPSPANVRPASNPTQVTYKAALGFRAHSGWAAMVAVGGPNAAPFVLQRRRVQLADRGIEGSSQLYHTAEQMSLPDATAFVQQCTVAAGAMAQAAIRKAISELAGKGYQFAGACVLLSSGRPLPDLAKTLASHALIHTAEGEFYRDALKTACRACGFVASGIPERDLLSRATAILQLSADDLQQRISELGKSVGPPWRQDEKLSALAGWISLCQDGE
jgi:hypothetical protein